MPTHNLKLFFVQGEPARGEIPGVLAHIALKHATEDSRHGETFVSHQCVGPTEFASEVRRLQNELNDILNEGLRRFAQHRANTIGDPAELSSSGAPSRQGPP